MSIRDSLTRGTPADFFLFDFREENARLKKQLNSLQQQQQQQASTNGKSTSSDAENCAILGVHLPAPTEYEYLRNILLKFMMGQEPLVSFWIARLGFKVSF